MASKPDYAALSSTEAVSELTDCETEEIELIFHGTGTSSGLPLIECLTADADAKKCRTCFSSLTPEGRKNARRNTGAIVRTRGPDGQWLTLVVDVGKTFMQAALELFPKHNLKKIDAVLITHAHADAMNGLDDLRGWTLGAAIQDHIDIYLTRATFEAVERCFPYLVDKRFASGGGDIPTFQWHIINANVPFSICNISILPFIVHHGKVFDMPSPTPIGTIPPFASLRSSDQIHTRLFSPPASPPNEPRPFESLGFAFGTSLCWISDVSSIPDASWEVLENQMKQKRFSVVVLDTLNPKPHSSHYGIAGAIAAAVRFGAPKNYLVGFSHKVAHEGWERICKAIGGEVDETVDDLSPMVEFSLSLVDPSHMAQSVWIRPAYDGMKLRISPEVTVEQ